MEYYQCKEGEDPMKMPQPDERNIKTAPRKPVVNKATQQQSAFAAQNLEDMVMYDVDREDCGECSRKINLVGHYTYVIVPFHPFSCQNGRHYIIFECEI